MKSKTVFTWECEGEGITKKPKKTFGGDEYIPYLDYGDRFSAVHICQINQNLLFM
jgi:hypothetical protein